MADESKLDERLMLRLPVALHSRIKTHATRNRRSLNSEIVAVLEEKYPAPAAVDVNAQLVTTAEKIVASWSRMLAAIGQDPDSNENLAAAREAIQQAKSAM